MRGARKIAGIAAALALLALLAVAALMLLPPLLGYKRYVIEGGSMGSAVPRGSIAYEEVVPAARIRVGDVITYRPPGRGGDGGLVTHRVAWTGRDRHGVRLYRTRGDANAAADPWTFTLPAPDQARVVFHVPLAGYAVAALSVRAVRMALIGGPALAIAFGAFGGLLPRRRRTAEAGVEPAVHGFG